MSVPLTPSGIRRVLDSRGLRPRRAHGQNFLADRNIRDAILELAGVSAGDLVLEVGPGLGALTSGLLGAGAEVVAAELDRGLCDFLREAFAAERRFCLVAGDALEGGTLAGAVRREVDRRRPAARRLLLVSNLPYSAGTPLLAALAREPDPPDRWTVMVQREVALRMAAPPGSPDYGPLAVLLALRGEVTIHREVPGHVFVPRTEVRSSVVGFVPGGPGMEDLLAGDRAARAAFLHRRKSVRKTLALAGPSRERVLATLSELGIDSGVRPEVLTPEQFVSIGRSLFFDRFDDGGPAG